VLVLPAMGQTADCEVEVDGKRDRGQVLLETSELIFRGTARLRIPFTAMKKVAVTTGGKGKSDAAALSITWAGKDKGTIVIPLGERAAIWAAKIKNPPGRMDKLGVKPGMSISIWGAIESAAIDELVLRAGAGVKVGRPRGGEALVFLAIERSADLGRVAEAAEKIAPDGAIWLIRRKGKDAAVSESESMAAGRAAGLYDTKVVAFSATHTAERYVIPVAHRPAKPKAVGLPRKPAARTSRAT
jgi:hypothetical protein